MSYSMQIEERTTIKKIDFNLAFVILALNLIGLINLYSASHTVHSTEMSSRFISQLVWVGVGWSVYIILSFIDYRFFT